MHARCPVGQSFSRLLACTGRLPVCTIYARAQVFVGRTEGKQYKHMNHDVVGRFVPEFIVIHPHIHSPLA